MNIFSTNSINQQIPIILPRPSINQDQDIQLSQFLPKKLAYPNSQTHHDKLNVDLEEKKRLRLIKNRAAADISRRRKREHLANLEVTTKQLEIENSNLKTKLSQIESANKEKEQMICQLQNKLNEFKILLETSNQKKNSNSEILNLEKINFSSDVSKKEERAGDLDFNEFVNFDAIDDYPPKLFTFENVNKEGCPYGTNDFEDSSILNDLKSISSSSLNSPVSSAFTDSPNSPPNTFLGAEINYNEDFDINTNNSGYSFGHVKTMFLTLFLSFTIIVNFNQNYTITSIKSISQSKNKENLHKVYEIEDKDFAPSSNNDPLSIKEVEIVENFNKILKTNNNNLICEFKENTIFKDVNLQRFLNKEGIESEENLIKSIEEKSLIEKPNFSLTLKLNKKNKQKYNWEKRKVNKIKFGEKFVLGSDESEKGFLILDLEIVGARIK
ncbi:hypothetical protein HK099_001018 [Clydaea vesicula]|uniref:BZIP domain-containing protein n=1 Tax=Clydaea vesicula TaxID=447962 RepID=A0AAD5TU35_9FUNG|nr:hypothetical protein HK099_001018 [Clydaea vesicula]